MLKKFRFKCIIVLVVLIIPFVEADKDKYDILRSDIHLAMQSSIYNPQQAYLTFNNALAAKKWLSTQSNRLERFVPDKFFRIRLLTIIQYEATRAELDPQLVLSLITIESKFNPYAISNVGALGLMQVMPFWQKILGSPEQNLFDINTNIRYGCSILAYYIGKEHGDLSKALSRYNGGNLATSNSQYSSLVLGAYNKYWRYPTISN